MADDRTNSGVSTPGDPIHTKPVTRSWAARWGFALALYVVFDGFSHGMFDVRPTSFISLTLVATVAALVLAAIDGRTPRLRDRSDAAPIALLLVAFVGYVSLSGLVWQGGLNLGFMKNLLLFLAIVALIDGERELKGVLFAAAAAGLVQAGLGVGQLVAEGGVPPGGVTGLLPNHVQYAVYLLLSGIALTPFLKDASVRRRIAVLGAEGLMIAMIVASLARGVLVAAVVCAVALALLAFDSLRLRILTVAGTGLTALAAVMASSRLGTLLEVPQALGDPARLDGLLSGRLSLLLAAWNIWWAHPVLGIGYGRFPVVSSQYAPAGIGRPELLRLELAAHSTYLQIAAELGLVGLALYVALITLGLRAAWHGRREAAHTRLASAGLLQAAVFVAILAVVLHGLLDNTGWHDRVFYVLLATAAVSGRVARVSGDAP